MNDFLMIAIAVVVISGGGLLLYFLLKKFFDKERDNTKKPQKSDDVKAKAAAEKKANEAEKKEAKIAEAKKAEAEKKQIAADKRKAEMMKKAMMEADPKVLQHSIIKKAVGEITAEASDIDLITVMANRIGRSYKEGTGKEPVNIFFDSPSLSRLEQGEMKLVAEHIYDAVKGKGFELKEVGSGEEGTYRYHIDKYEIKAY